MALIVLVMVFFATPLPFEAVVHGASLYLWWAVVSLLYFAASDFFQVARLVAFIQFWRLDRGAVSETISDRQPAAVNAGGSPLS